jgi:predicted nucleotidyltransferase
MKKQADIAGLRPDELEKLRGVFETEPSVAKVILYGSRAKGTYRPGSDIDLTLKGQSLTMDRLMDLSSKIDDLLLPYEVDLSIYDHIDNLELRDHINRVGKVVFDHER